MERFSVTVMPSTFDFEWAKTIGLGRPWRLKVEAAEPPAPTNRKHVLALSGGKDSSAMALATAIFEPADYHYACTPTGNELPEMTAHWEKLERLLGKPIIRLQAQSLMGLIMKQMAIPNHAARWCTRIIKLEQYYKWLDSQGPCISHVGLRADEESRPGMIFPDAGETIMDFPMRRWGWTLQDVLDFLSDFGITIPDRTDCAVCFWQKLGEWFLLWRDHRELFDQGALAEKIVTEKRGVAYTFRSPQRDTWPASLEELGKRFAAGDIPTRSLKMMDKHRQVGACRACTL